MVAPKGKTCSLSDTEVTGNLTIERGSTLNGAS
jgi:hypothetical protein